MEPKFLDGLHSNLAKAILEKIETEVKTSDYALIEKDLNLLRALHQKAPVAVRSLHNALQFVLANASLSDEQCRELEQELESFGGRSVKAAAIAQPSEETTPLLQRSVSFSELLEPAEKVRNGEYNSLWAPLMGDALESFLDNINPIDGKYEVDFVTTYAAWTWLPFYKNVKLVRIVDPLWLNEDVVIYYLITANNNLYRLNGTSPPIHEINIKAPLDLSDENVIDYLKFFCFFVHGDEGPFYILESIDDVMLPAIDDGTTLSILTDEARPVQRMANNESGDFVCEAVIFYSNAIFSGSFAIAPNGMIALSNDNPIAGDLLARIQAPLG